MPFREPCRVNLPANACKLPGVTLSLDSHTQAQLHLPDKFFDWRCHTAIAFAFSNPVRRRKAGKTFRQPKQFSVENRRSHSRFPGSWSAAMLPPLPLYIAQDRPDFANPGNGQACFRETEAACPPFHTCRSPAVTTGALTLLTGTHDAGSPRRNGLPAISFVNR